MTKSTNNKAPHDLNLWDEYEHLFIPETCFSRAITIKDIKGLERHVMIPDNVRKEAIKNGN